LFLVFDRDVPGLKQEHITVSSEIPELQDVSVQGISKTDDRPGVYTLALGGIDTLETSLWPIDTFSGELAVTVEANAIPGYRVANPSHAADIYVVPPRRTVWFSDTETGGEANKKTTAWITFRLNPEEGVLNNLERGNVVLSGIEDANAEVKTGGAPESIGNGAWKVPVTNIDTEGMVTVTLTRNGYRFDPPSIPVQVHYAKPVTLVAAAADGDELLAQRTTELTLTFDESIDNLLLTDITITANNTNAAKGSLLPRSGNSYTLTLQKDSVTMSGKIKVTVAKDGYDISNETVEVAVYDNLYNYLATGGTPTVAKVDGIYYETHQFTSTTTGQTLAFTNNVPAGLKAQVLVVAGGGGGGNSTTIYADQGGGGGGGGVGYAESFALAKTTNVTVGAGVGAETNGKDSSFGTVTVKGGGAGGSGGGQSNLAGKDGGSGGGAGAGDASIVANGGTAVTYGSVSGFTFYGSAGAASGEVAGGAGGSADFESDISGTKTKYGNGGVANGGDAAANIGAGGGGSKGGDRSVKGPAGGTGGSGIVIVRFPVPSAQ
jgi:hypothetical protein